MAAIAAKFAEAFRNWATEGVPSSGVNEPDKADIRAIGPLIETALANIGLAGMLGVTKDTRANLNADLAHGANTVALVYADATDANNDLYIKVGGSGTGSWTLTSILHDIIEALGAPIIAQAEDARDEVVAAISDIYAWARAIYTVAAGYYAANGDAVNGGGVAAWRRAQVAVVPGEVYRITSRVVGGVGVLGLATFVTGGGTFIDTEFASSGTPTNYVEQEVTVPATAGFMRVNGYEGYPFYIEKRSPPSTAEADDALGSLSVWEPVGTVSPGYADKDSGTIVNTAGWNTISYTVTGPGRYRHTSRVAGGLTAELVYRDETAAFYGSINPGSGTAVDYTNEEFDVPGGVGTILITGFVTTGFPLRLERLVVNDQVGRDVRAIEEQLANAPTAFPAETFTGPADGSGIYAYADPNHWVILVTTLSQSNGFGHSDDAGDTLYGAAAEYPDNAFMFQSGVHRAASHAGETGLVPLIEQVYGSAKSTASSSWANHLIRDVEDATGVYPKVLAFNASIGGEDLADLGRGGLADGYRAFLAGLDDAKIAIRAAGGTRITVVVDIMQGEEETGKQNLYQRKRALRAAIRRLRADVADRFGESEPAIVLITQPASIRHLNPADLNDGSYTNPADPDYPLLWTGQGVRLAPLDLDRDGEATLAGPMYMWPQSVPPGNNYLIHLSCEGQNYRGQQLARATLAELFGQGWRGFRLIPESLRWTSTTVLKIDVDAPGTLVLDTTDAVVDRTGLVNSTGIEAYSEAFTVPAFTPTVSGRTLTLTFVTRPTGPFRLGIAVGTNVANIEKDGPDAGARSILRDNTAHVNIYGGVNQANWCPTTILAVPTAPV